MTRFVPLISTLMILATFGRVMGQAEQPPLQKSSEVFSADTETMLGKFLQVVKEKRTKLSWDEMQALINDMGKQENLTPDQKVRLAEAAKPMVTNYVDTWLKDTEKALRHVIATGRGNQVDQMMAASDQIAANGFLCSTPPPSDQEAWAQAVHGVLTADQAAIWDKGRADLRLAEDQKYNGVLDPAVKLYHERESQRAQAFCHQVEEGFTLDQDTKDKLETLAGQAVDQSTEQWRAGVKQVLKGLGPMNVPLSNFVPMINSFKSEIGRDFSDGYDEQPVWKKSINDILTVAQIEKIKSFSAESVSDRVRIMGLVFLELMDQKVGFKSSQLDQLKSISERLVKDDNVLCPKFNADFNGSGFSPNYVYVLAKKATDDELKPILDPIQLSRWKGDDQDAPQPNQAPPIVVLPPGPDLDNEPEHVEQSISRKLYDDEVSERKMVLDAYLLKIEYLNRILSPTPELADKLRFTVLALAEKQMFILKTSSEQQLRTQLADVKPESVDERLLTVVNFVNRFNVIRGNGGGGLSEFDSLVVSLFSREQLDTIRKESDARQDFCTEAECEVISDDFSRNFSLDNSQRKKFLTLVQNVMKDYGEDIPNSVNPYMGGDNVPWYLSPNLEFLPVTKVSETDLKTVLSDDQFKEWRLSQEQISAQNYWPQVEQFHQNRVQAQLQGRVQPLKL